MEKAQAVSTFLGIPLETLGATGIWVSIAGIVFGIFKVINEGRKSKADAHKTHAEADEIEAKASTVVIANLLTEVTRLKVHSEEQDKLIDALRSDVDRKITHTAKLEQENRALNEKVDWQGRRIAALEDVLKVHPITPEMQAILDRVPARY